VAREIAEVESKLKRVSLDAEEAVLRVRAKSLQTELVAKKVEKALLLRTTETRELEFVGRRVHMRELRGADTAKRRRKGKPA
jgi:circadian clock protein KaiC